MTVLNLFYPSAVFCRSRKELISYWITNNSFSSVRISLVVPQPCSHRHRASSVMKMARPWSSSLLLEGVEAIAYSRRSRNAGMPIQVSPFLLISVNGLYQSAFLGQVFTHSMHKTHSVPFILFLELSVTSTFIGHTRLHLPQEIHLLLSHWMRDNEK